MRMCSLITRVTFTFDNSNQPESAGERCIPRRLIVDLVEARAGNRPSTSLIFFADYVAHWKKPLQSLVETSERRGAIITPHPRIHVKYFLSALMPLNF